MSAAIAPVSLAFQVRNPIHQVSAIPSLFKRSSVDRNILVRMVQCHIPNVSGLNSRMALFGLTEAIAY
jgi:hypothetical protein